MVNTEITITDLYVTNVTKTSKSRSIFYSEIDSTVSITNMTMHDSIIRAVSLRAGRFYGKNLHYENIYTRTRIMDFRVMVNVTVENM